MAKTRKSDIGIHKCNNNYQKFHPTQLMEMFA